MLTRVQRFSAKIMCLNAEWLAQCPEQDRLAVVRHAALLTMVSVASATAWVGFAWQFVRLAIAIPCGVFAGAFIFLIDLSIGAADSMLTGILRRPGARRDNAQRVGLGVRLLMTLGLSFATSDGAASMMFQKAVERQRLADVRALNIEVDERAAEKVRILRQQRLGGEQAEVNEKQLIVQQTMPLLDKAGSAEADATARSKAAAEEADKELKGGNGYLRCPAVDTTHCPLLRAALKAKQQAEVDLAREGANRAAFEARLNKAEADVDAARARLRAAVPAIQAEVDRIEAERVASQVTDVADPLINAMALQEVMNDPKTGAEARRYSWMMMAVLMTIELAYIVVRILFEPASIYAVLQVKETKLEAYRHKVDFDRKMLEIGYVKIERPALRVVPGDP